MNLEKPENFVEALIFASETSIGMEEISQVLEELQGKKIKPEKIVEMIDGIRIKYRALDLALELVQTC